MFPLHVHRLPEDNGATRTKRAFPVTPQAGFNTSSRTLSLSHPTHQDATKGGSSRALTLRALRCPAHPSPDNTGHGLCSDSNDIIMYLL